MGTNYEGLIISLVVLITAINNGNYLGSRYTPVMKIFNKSKSLFLLSLLILASCDRSGLPVNHSDADLAEIEAHRAEVLINPEWLAANLSNPGVHILEMGRTAYEYSFGHIPGAKFMDWRTDISDQSQPEKFNILPRQEFESLMRELGITTDSTIVLYDTLSSRLSARMFWTLKYYMHESVKVLDGGMEAWKANYPLTDATTYIAKTNYAVETVRGTILVDMDYLLRNLSDSNLDLVDGRPFDQYTGESDGTVFNTGSAHDRLGHIYGAQSVPWASNLLEDGSFRSTEELFALYEAHEIEKGGIVVTYCNEGLHAAMPWFVLSELLGYEDVRLYESSMAEWGNLSDTPMITGEHCM